jgi:hypothetical protein
MENIQEAVLKKIKGTTDEEILRTAKEWIPDLIQLRKMDTKFFRLARVYWMTKETMTQQ